MKRVLITGGPTNEHVDEVMKITNMSTGSFSVALAKGFLKKKYEVCLIINKSVDVKAIENNKHIKIIKIETTENLKDALEKESKVCDYDVLIHAAAVADYTPEYTFLLDDVASEIFDHIEEINSPQEIYDILCDPQCKLDNTSKMSSNQSDLTIKMGLTPKIISSLRNWYKDSLIVGCKLLENVSKEELFDVAKKLCNKNSVDLILANDLADLRKGNKTRYVVNKDGYLNIELESATKVVEYIESKI